MFLKKYFITLASISKLKKDIIIYSFGNFLISFSTFFLIPFYINKINIEEYGLLSLALLVPIFFNILFTFSLDGSIMRYYHEWVNQSLEKEAIFTIWITTIIWSIFIFIIVFFWGENLFRNIFRILPFFPHVIIVLLTSIISITNLFTGKILRIQEKSILFILLNYFGSFLKIILIVLFVNYYDKSASAVLLAGLVGEIILLIPSFYILFGNFKLKYNFSLMKNSLIFQLPGVPGALLLNFTFLIDRFLIDKYFVISEVGVYSLALKIGSILIAFTSVFQLALTPIIIKIASSNNAEIKISKIKNEYLNFISFLAISLILFSREILIFFAHINLQPTNQVLLWLILAFYFQAISYIPNLQIFLSNKLSYSSFSAIMFILSFLFLGNYLRGLYGLIGVSIAFFQANFLSFVFSNRIGNKFYNLPNHTKFLRNFIFIIFSFLGSYITIDNSNYLMLVFKIIFLFITTYIIFGEYISRFFFLNKFLIRK